MRSSFVLAVALAAACLGTSYVPRQSNFGVFGMGFATSDDPTGPIEHLYVAGDRAYRKLGSLLDSGEPLTMRPLIVSTTSMRANGAVPTGAASPSSC